jgi:inosine-uridine nucleoside N-ribohydrolase
MRIVIDTDPAMGSLGGDPEDSFAIILALNSPEFTIEALTIVQGNVPVEHGYANARHLLSLLGRGEVPVLRGLGEPLDARRTDQRAWLAQRRSLQRIAPLVEPPAGEPGAVDFLVETILENPGEITLVTIGPLSNLAAALRREPAIAGKLAGLVAMGGNARVPGNITPLAEFNFWADPEAAAIVLASGLRMKMVGLDVCEQTHLREEQVRALQQSPHAVAKFVGDSVAPFIELRRNLLGAADLHLYDSLAVAAAFRPDLVETRPAFVAVETEGRRTQGATVAYLDPIARLWETADANADVALEVRSAEFEQLFHARVIQRLLCGADAGRVGAEQPEA